MPSPVAPNDICELTPSATTNPCEALKRIFFDIPTKICQLVSWMFDADGGVSQEFISDVIPSGVIMNYGGTEAPEGWLFCNGTAYKQADYPALFAIIGTRFGSGNGVDEFQVPDHRKSVVVGWDPSDPSFSVGSEGGSNEHTLTEAQTPAHRHLMFANPDAVQDGDGNPAAWLNAEKVPDWRGTYSSGDGGNSYVMLGSDPDEDDAVYGLTGLAGGGAAFSLMQQYVVEAAIIKI